MRSNNPIANAESLLVLVLLSAVYFVLRAPTLGLELPYYDDAETLYHAMTLLQGKLWYRDDVSHHFLGYAVPVALYGKFAGLDVHSIIEFRAINQLLTALGLFWTLRLFLGLTPAVLGAGMLLSASEPRVLGFYQQYQINFCYSFALLFACLSVIRNSKLALIGCAISCGVALTFDQRAIFLCAIPALTVFFLKRQRLYNTAIALTAYAVAPALALAYLWRHGLLLEFYEQTYFFPKNFRAASYNLLEVLSQGLAVHKYLYEFSPTLLFVGLVGWYALVTGLGTARFNFNSMNEQQTKALKLVLYSALPIALMPLFGARDFSYYIVTWYPFLAFSGAFLPALFGNTHSLLRIPAFMICASATIIPLVVAVEELQAGTFKQYSGDGAAEVAAELRSRMAPSDSLYLWAYRLEIYVRLSRVSAFPFANRLMIHPDHKIIDPAARAAHIFPKYSDQFIAEFRASPPDYLVLFDRNGLIDLPSPAQSAVMSSLSSQYERVFSLEKKDLTGANCIWTIYHRRGLG